MEALAPYAELTAPPAGWFATWLMPPGRALAAQAGAREAGLGVRLLQDCCRGATLGGLVVGVGAPSDEQLDRVLAALVAGCRSSAGAP